MLGAILGDIIGSPYEFNNTSNPGFPLLSSESCFTDDTVCTVAVADALLEKGLDVTSIDFGVAIQKWARRYPNPKGAYGTSFFRNVVSVEAAAPPVPYYSWGNGAAMRVSPVALVGSNDADVIRLALDAAQCTHNHPEGLIGAMVTALICLRFRSAFDVDALSDCEQIMLRFYGAGWRDRLPLPGAWDESCQGCVPLAYSLVRAASGFEDAVRSAVLYGGDSDTLGAIVGAMAEHRFGIPAALRAAGLALLSPDLKIVVENFYKKFGNEKL